MDLKRTAGDWRADQTFDVTGGADTTHNGTPAISIYGNGSQIALVLGNGKGESAGNVRLIEAAPDLLQVCELLLYGFDTLARHEFSEGWQSTLREKAREVIALATGEKRRQA